MPDDELFLARQPIFDRKGDVWGYELLYRSSGEAQTMDMDDLDASTLKVAAGLLLSPDQNFSVAQSLVNCSRGFLLNGYAKGLAAGGVTLSVPQELLHDAAVLEVLDQAAAGGARLSLALDCSGAPPVGGIQRFSLVELSSACLQAATCWSWLQHRDPKRTLLLVNHIESHDDHELAAAAGAGLFQGFYYQRPKTYSLKPLSVTVLNRFKILQLLESDSRDSKLLTHCIEAEVSIAVRLLRFVNSPAFGFVRTIDSVNQAVTLIGWEPLRNWLRLVVVSDMPPTDKSRELAYSSAINAKFLELLALYAYRPELADKLYLVGLLSQLEPMLDKSYKSIFTALPLNKDVEQALLGTGGELKPWLDFVRQLDSGNWLHIDANAAALRIPLKAVSKAKLEAVSWANEFFNVVKFS